MINFTDAQYQEQCEKFVEIIKHSDHYYELPVSKIGCWVTTESSSNAPDFIDSADAHIKWTFPKLFEKKYLVSMGRCYVGDGVSLNEYGSTGYSWECTITLSKHNEVCGLDKSLSLAICKAISQLMEKK